MLRKINFWYLCTSRALCNIIKIDISDTLTIELFGFYRFLRLDTKTIDFILCKSKTKIPFAIDLAEPIDTEIIAFQYNY